MWRMLQRDQPEDYVIATGEAHTVRDVCEVAFGKLGLDWQKHVEVDERYKRPTEVDALCGDASKARRLLNWTPRVGFRDLIQTMAESDLELARQEQTLRAAGHEPTARGAATR